MALRRSPIVACVALLSVACGDDDAPDDAAMDAAPEDASTRMPMPPIAPDEAALPVLSPCPDGWSERVTPTGLAYCDPFGDAPPDCARGFMRLPGRATCEPVGDVCPRGDFPDPLPEEPLVFVRAGAAEGDGSVARPYATIGEAIAAASPSATIVIAAGRYEEALVIDDPVSLIGACARETVIANVSGSGAGLRIVGARVHLRDVTILGALEGGIDVRDHGEAFLEDVRSSVDVGAVALLVSGSKAHVTRAAFDGRVTVLLDSEVDFSDVAIQASGGAGLSTSESTLSSVRLTVVRKEDERPSVVGISSSGGRVELRETAILGWLSALSATRATLDLDWLYGSAFGGSPTSVGAFSSLGSTGSVRHLFLSGGKPARIEATESPMIGEHLELSDVIAEPRDGEPMGIGMYVVATSVTVQRVALVGSQGIGVAVTSGGAVDGHDLTVRDTHASDEDLGYGLLVTNSAIDLDRLTIAGSDDVGAFFSDALPSRVADLHVRDIGAAPGTGFGVVVSDGSELTLGPTRITGARVVGMGAFGEGTRISGTDVAIEDAPIGAQETFGRGIEVEEAAFVELERVRIAQTRDHAILSQSGATVRLAEVDVEDTGARGCALTTCEGEPFGIGLGVYGATASLENFALRGAALCGVRFALGADASLHEGTISNNVVGVCVDDPGLDIGRIFDGVRFESNGADLDVHALPVPSPLPPIPEPLVD